MFIRIARGWLFLIVIEAVALVSAISTVIDGIWHNSLLNFVTGVVIAAIMGLFLRTDLKVRRETRGRRRLTKQLRQLLNKYLPNSGQVALTSEDESVVLKHHRLWFQVVHFTREEWEEGYDPIDHTSKFVVTLFSSHRWIPDTLVAHGVMTAVEVEPESFSGELVFGKQTRRDVLSLLKNELIIADEGELQEVVNCIQTTEWLLPEDEEEDDE